MAPQVGGRRSKVEEGAEEGNGRPKNRVSNVCGRLSNVLSIANKIVASAPRLGDHHSRTEVQEV
jgi:hypothetical protein